MSNSVHYFNLILGAGVIILQLLTLKAVLILIFSSKKNKFLDLIQKHFLLIGLFISGSAAIFSYIYSEVVNFLPCYLCWWQRVFLFPVAFLFAVAYWKNDRGVARYAFPLLAVGFLISLYHNFFYYFGETSALPCDASGVSCYQHLVSEFGGYISIPMMALTPFVALLVLLAVKRFYKGG